MPPGSNNPFGIKAAAGQPCVTVRMREESRSGRSVHIRAAFPKFATLADASRCMAACLPRTGPMPKRDATSMIRTLMPMRSPDATRPIRNMARYLNPSCAVGTCIATMRPVLNHIDLIQHGETCADPCRD